MKLISVERIWHDEKHNAFTDLCSYQNRYYITFRSATDHYSLDGGLIILCSEDGTAWKKVADIKSPRGALRDAKFSSHPDGSLLLHSAYIRDHNEQRLCQSIVYRSADGQHWDDGKNTGDENIWIWRAKWNRGSCHAIGYSTKKPLFTRLYESTDGLHYRALVAQLFDTGFSNESDWIYLQDGTMVVLLRRDGKEDNSAMLGLAKPGYTDWSWHDLQIRIGGPALLQLDNGDIIAVIRTYHEDNAQTELFKLDLEQKSLEKLITLPSSGDCSYAGVIQKDSEVWISYYSSHEDDSTDIYLAKLQV